MTPYVNDSDFVLYVGDVRDCLRELPAASVHTVVTSPPYWGLRDYSTEGQIGLEPTPEAFVTAMVDVFREVHRVLRDDGTLWLNLGDSYAGGGGYAPDAPINQRRANGEDWGKFNPASTAALSAKKGTGKVAGLKSKDMVGIPWRVAFALQADGWYLRSDIIWSKPNPMPESVTDRPTKAHEYVFLLSKSPRYFFDQEAVREKYAYPDDVERPRFTAHAPGQDPHSDARGPDGRRRTHVAGSDGSIQHRDGERWPNGGRNVRSVWEIATQPYPDAHFATFPEALPERCIKAGCPELVCADCGRPVTPVRSEDDSTTVQGVRRDVHEAGAERVLLAGVRESGDGTEPSIDAGVRGERQGLQNASGAGSSDGESGRLRNGAPRSDGGAPGPDAAEGRGGSPQERRQAGQQDRESRGHAETSARSEGEAGAEADPVSTLRRARSSAAPCSETCSGRVTPGVVLDPFLGSGTTAHVARRLGRRSIGIELNPEYAELCARRLQQLSLLA